MSDETPPANPQHLDALLDATGRAVLMLGTLDTFIKEIESRTTLDRDGVLNVVRSLHADATFIHAKAAECLTLTIAAAQKAAGLN